MQHSPQAAAAQPSPAAAPVAAAEHLIGDLLHDQDLPALLLETPKAA
jgi:hypothetical protein